MVEKEKGCNAANCDKHCSLCYLWVIPEGLVLYRSLGRGYTSDRYAEGRAADVVHAEFGAELDAGGFASVFATDTYLEVRLHGLSQRPFSRADLHQPDRELRKDRL